MRRERAAAIGEPWSLAIEGSSPSLEPALAGLRGGGLVAVAHPSEVGGVGCLVACGDGISAENMTLMLVQARGVPYLALAAERCKLLGLRPQRSDSGAEREDYMVTIEARNGVSTGVSAADRARTMRVATADHATRGDVIVPGHVPPIRVHPHGMLHRAGLPEAALDLASLAGAPHGAAFCHIMEEDGSSGASESARRLSERFDLPLVTTPDVLDSMLSMQRLVVPAGEQAIETAHGTFEARLFRDPFAGGTHVAVVLGDIAGPEPLPVVVLTQALVADVFGQAPTHRIDAALTALGREGRGAILYLAPAESATDLSADDTASSPHTALLRATRRSHVVTQMLRALGVTSVRRIESG